MPSPSYDSQELSVRTGPQERFGPNAAGHPRSFACQLQLRSRVPLCRAPAVTPWSPSRRPSSRSPRGSSVPSFD
eukprot:8429097-Alexandrium_andersonii.AAC.1